MSYNIKYIDFLGLEPKLLINNDDRYKSKSGGVMSIFLIIFCLLFIIYSGLKMLNKQTPFISNRTHNIFLVSRIERIIINTLEINQYIH